MGRPAQALPPTKAPRERLGSTRITPRTVVASLLLVSLALVPPLSAAFGEPFYITLFTRIVIFALAAVGLNLALGFGGLVSFGHALYLGIGAYAVGILSFHGITSGIAHLVSALAVSAIVAVLVGLVCLRTSGMAFIMITLAFAQMFYFLAVSLKHYGGDDGLSIAARSDFGFIDLSSNTVLYYTAFVALAAALYTTHRIVNARFGMVIRGCKANERRMRMLGFATLRYKLAAYVLSALICVVAGVLLANLAKFASPSYMQWSVSGELIVMVVLGGLGTVLGPLVGALVLIVLEEILPALKVGVPAIDAILNNHWLGIIGLLIVLVTLTVKRGIYGYLGSLEKGR